MSNSFQRILCLAAALVLLCAAVCSASPVTVVSPADGSIVSADNLLVSVKLTEKKTVTVSVYEERSIVSGAAVTVSAGPAVSPAALSVSPAAISSAAIDVKSFTENDLRQIEAVYAGTATQPAILSSGQFAERYLSVPVTESAEFTNTTEVGFYTKQISGLAPGLYRVEVTELSPDGTTVVLCSSFVALKEKQEETPSVFEKQQGGAMQFLQDLLRSIFK